MLPCIVVSSENIIPCGSCSAFRHREVPKSSRHVSLRVPVTIFYTSWNNNGLISLGRRCKEVQRPEIVQRSHCSLFSVACSGPSGFGRIGFVHKPLNDLVSAINTPLCQFWNSPGSLPYLSWYSSECKKTEMCNNNSKNDGLHRWLRINLTAMIHTYIHTYHRYSATHWRVRLHHIRCRINSIKIFP